MWSTSGVNRWENPELARFFRKLGDRAPSGLGVTHPIYPLGSCAFSAVLMRFPRHVLSCCRHMSAPTVDQ